jgi:hypothetical protein
MGSDFFMLRGDGTICDLATEPEASIAENGKVCLNRLK